MAIHDNNILRKRNIMVVGPVPPPYGGIALYVKRILESHLSNQFNLYLFNTSIPENIRAFNASTERGYTEIFKQRRLFYFFQYIILDFYHFLRRIVDEHIFIVHIHTCSFWGYYRSVIYLIISKIVHRKVIFHLHNAIDRYYFEESGPFTRILIKLSLKLADVDVALSPKLACLVNEISGYKGNVYSIETGIQLEPFHKIKRQNHSNRNDKIDVITIGKLSYNKGSYDILKSIPKVVSKYDKICFRYIGHGDQNSLTALAKKNNILEYCDFTGPIGEFEKIQLLQRSQLFLLPSHAEGHPAVILEAMAVGLPVIATKVGAIPEVIQDGINGFIIEPGDVDMLADRIITLIFDADLRCRMGEINYHVARERYGIQRVFNEIGAIYQNLSQ